MPKALLQKKDDKLPSLSIFVKLDGLFLCAVKFACIFTRFLAELPDQKNYQKPAV